MPPKRARAPPKPRGQKPKPAAFFLVYWYPLARGLLGQVSVVERKVIPKGYHDVGKEPLIPWEEKKGEKGYFKARVVAEG